MLKAQPSLAPAAAQSEAVVITGATIHVGDGTVIENGSIRFEEGKITEIGPDVNPGGANLIDAQGKHVYPGFIAMNTVLGLTEVGAVRATRDENETGDVNPNVRALVAYKADSDVPPTVRSNGVLTAQIVPQGGVVSGTSSTVVLDAWNWEDAAYQADEGLWVSWPSSVIRSGFSAPPAEEQRKQREKNLTALKDFVKQAAAYARIGGPDVKNLRFEAVKGIFGGTKKLYVRADAAKDIVAAVKFFTSLEITPVIVGGSEAYLVTGLLKEHDVPVVLASPHSLPSNTDEDIDMPYKIASLLKEAGVRFCISTDGFWQLRNLPFMAGTAAAYGLDKEEALKAVTLDAARILGAGQTTGSLETGKDATLFVSSGDALDMRGNHVEAAFISGRQIDLDNKQKQLYQKYLDKYRAQGLIPVMSDE